MAMIETKEPRKLVLRAAALALALSTAGCAAGAAAGSAGPLQSRSGLRTVVQPRRRRRWLSFLTRLHSLTRLYSLSAGSKAYVCLNRSRPLTGSRSGVNAMWLNAGSGMAAIGS